MADQKINITLNAVDNATKALNDVKNSIKNVGNETDKTSTSFFTLKNAIIGIATSAVVKQIVDVTKSFQDLRNNLAIATGSIEKGNQTFQYLSEFAKDSKFSVQDLTKSFLTLYQNGVEPTDRLLNTFAKTAGNATNKIDALNDLTRLFAKGAQGGFNIMALNQLVLNGIPAFEILRQELGLDEKSLMRLANTADGTKLILDNLLIGLEKRASNSVTPVRDLSDAFNSFFKQIQNALFAIGDTPQLVNLIDLFSKLLINLQPLFVLIGLFVEQGLKAINFALDVVNPLLELMGSIISDLLSPLKKVVDFIDQYFISALNKITGAINKLKEYYLSLKKTIFGEDLAIKIAPEVEKTKNKLNLEMPEPIELSGLQKTIQAMQVATFDLKAQFKEIYSTIAQGLVGGIKDVSRAIAESIVLGKKLQASFADIARNLLVKIISGLIEEQLAKLALLALDEIAVLLGLKRLAIEKQITAEKRKQAKEGTTIATPEDLAKKQLGNIFDELWDKLKTTFDDIFGSIGDIFGNISDYSSQIFSDIGSSLMNILGNLGSSVGDIFNSIGGSFGDILGSIGNIFGGGGGGGGFGFEDFIPSIIDFVFFAEGGAVTAGQPYMVGERGRELFIPNQNGTMVPNQDLGKAGNMNINFTINATDVKGVQELLINNRATITNLINQALNARGKANLV